MDTRGPASEQAGSQPHSPPLTSAHPGPTRGIWGCCWGHPGPVELRTEAGVHGKP